MPMMNEVHSYTSLRVQLCCWEDVECLFPPCAARQLTAVKGSRLNSSERLFFRTKTSSHAICVDLCVDMA